MLASIICECQSERGLLPEFDEVVAATGDEAFDVVGLLSGRLLDQAARHHGGSPADRVTADLTQTNNGSKLGNLPGATQRTSTRSNLKITKQTNKYVTFA